MTIHTEQQPTQEWCEGKREKWDSHDCCRRPKKPRMPLPQPELTRESKWIPAGFV
jgi:hypothetical protein